MHVCILYMFAIHCMCIYTYTYYIYRKRYMKHQNGCLNVLRFLRVMKPIVTAQKMNYKAANVLV